MNSFRLRDDQDPPAGGDRNAPADSVGSDGPTTHTRARPIPVPSPIATGPGMEARLCYIGDGPMENLSGLLVMRG